METLPEMTDDSGGQTKRCVMCQKQCSPLFTFPCHVVCTSCLHLLLSHRDPSDIIECPECHRMYPFTDQWRQHNVLSVRNDQVYTAVLRRCQRCRTRKAATVALAEQYCYQCQQPLCRHCHVTLHTSTRRRRHHIVVPLLPSEWVLWQQTGVTWCLTHEDQSLSLFCVTCRVALCGDCAELEHAGHELWDVGMSLQNARNILKSRLGAMEEHREVLRRLLAFFQSLDQIVGWRQQPVPRQSHPGNFGGHTGTDGAFNSHTTAETGIAEPVPRFLLGSVRRGKRSAESSAPSTNTQTSPSSGKDTPGATSRETQEEPKPQRRGKESVRRSQRPMLGRSTNSSSTADTGHQVNQRNDQPTQDFNSSACDTGNSAAYRVNLATRSSSNNQNSVVADNKSTAGEPGLRSAKSRRSSFGRKLVTVESLVRLKSVVATQLFHSQNPTIVSEEKASRTQAPDCLKEVVRTEQQKDGSFAEIPEQQNEQSTRRISAQGIEADRLASQRTATEGKSARHEATGSHRGEHLPFGSDDEAENVRESKGSTDTSLSDNLPRLVDDTEMKMELANENISMSELVTETQTTINSVDENSCFPELVDDKTVDSAIKNSDRQELVNDIQMTVKPGRSENSGPVQLAQAVPGVCFSEHLWCVRTAYDVLDCRIERLAYELNNPNWTSLTCLSMWINARPVISEQVYNALKEIFPENSTLLPRDIPAAPYGSQFVGDGGFAPDVRTGSFDCVSGEFFDQTTHTLHPVDMGTRHRVQDSSSCSGLDEIALTEETDPGLAIERKVDKAISMFYSRHRPQVFTASDEDTIEGYTFYQDHSATVGADRPLARVGDSESPSSSSGVQSNHSGSSEVEKSSRSNSRPTAHEESCVLSSVSSNSPVLVSQSDLSPEDTNNTLVEIHESHVSPGRSAAEPGQPHVGVVPGSDSGHLEPSSGSSSGGSDGEPGTLDERSSDLNCPHIAFSWREGSGSSGSELPLSLSGGPSELHEPVQHDYDYFLHSDVVDDDADNTAGAELDIYVLAGFSRPHANLVNTRSGQLTAL